MKAVVSAAFLALVPLAAKAQPAQGDYARGVQLREAGKPAEAVVLLERAAKATPADADIWLNLGLAYSAAGRHMPAERALNEALRLKPDYLDVQIALAQAAFFRDDLKLAQARLDPVLLRDPQNAQAKTLQAQIERARGAVSGAWRLDTSLSFADYSNGIQSGRGGSVFLGRSFSKRRYVSAGFEYVDQFGLSDVYYQLQAGGRWGYVSAGATPNAHFRPRWSVGGGLAGPAWSIGGGWTAQLAADAIYARYPVGPVVRLDPSLTLTRGDALTLTARWFNTRDETGAYRTGYGVRGAWRPLPKLQLIAGWSSGPESNQGRTTILRTVTGGVAYDINARTTVRIDVAHEKRTLYDRDQVSFGLTRRF